MLAAHVFCMRKKYFHILKNSSTARKKCAVYFIFFLGNTKKSEHPPRRVCVSARVFELRSVCGSAIFKTQRKIISCLIFISHVSDFQCMRLYERSKIWSTIIFKNATAWHKNACLWRTIILLPIGHLSPSLSSHKFHLANIQQLKNNPELLLYGIVCVFFNVN